MTQISWCIVDEISCNILVIAELLYCDIIIIVGKISQKYHIARYLVIPSPSIPSLHPLKDPTFVLYKGESFGKTLLTSSAVVKWDGLAFCLIFTSRFLPPRSTKMTIYITCLSEGLAFVDHKCIFSLSSFFFGCAKNLGICKATKDSSRASSKKRCMKEHLWAASGGAFELGQPSSGVVM